MADFLVISQLYQPEPNIVPSDVARMLAEHGTVTVITAHPNYPLGRFYPEVRSIRPARTQEGRLVVWRLPMYPDHGRSVLRRGLSYLSFMAAALLFAPFVAGRPRLVWVYNTPVTNYVAALPFRWLYRSRLVVTVADLWPESLLATGVVREGFVIGLVRRFSQWINRSADLLICATRTPLEALAAQGIPSSRLVHVPVWTEGAEQDAAGAAPPSAGGAVARIVYAGNVGEAQWLDPVIEAAAQMQQQRLPVQVDIYGDGTELDRLQRLAAARGASNVVFHGRVPPEVALAASAAALAQVVTLKPSPAFRMTVPSKLMFAFAAGTPVLYCLEGEAADIAAASGGAWPIAPDDPGSMVEAARRLLGMTSAERSEVRQRLQDFYRANYARARLLGRYRELLAGAAPQDTGGR